jgi:hypothetical protein
MSIFLFLEIQDPLVVELLTSLKSIFNNKPSVSPIHVTVRGPYKKIPDEGYLEKLWDTIEGEGVLLNGIRHFEFENKRYVYIKTHSRAIRKIWWKSDYPIVEYGFNPHITLFEGPINIAEKIEAFLKEERLEFYCHNLSLRLYTPGQSDLFGNSKREIYLEHSTKDTNNILTQPYRWEEGIEERARELMIKIKAT